MARMCRKANSCTLGECKLVWPLWKTVWRFLKKLKTELSWVHVCMLTCFHCVQLYDPMDCSPSGSSFHGILQARILEWVAMPFSRGSSWSRDWTHVSFVTWTGRPILDHQRHLGSPRWYHGTLLTQNKPLALSWFGSSAEHKRSSRDS